MSNQDKDSKLFTGLLIGGAVGLGALVFFLATRKEKAPMNAIGEAILRVGEILEDHNIDEPETVRRFEKKVHSHENTIGDVVNWVATGIQLWKKFKH